MVIRHWRILWVTWIEIEAKTDEKKNFVLNRRGIKNGHRITSRVEDFSLHFKVSTLGKQRTPHHLSLQIRVGCWLLYIFIFFSWSSAYLKLSNLGHDVNRPFDKHGHQRQLFKEFWKCFGAKKIQTIPVFSC